MRRLLPFLILFCAVSVQAQTPNYGGRTDILCTATGWFHTQKIGSRWWLCDPNGYVFFWINVDDVAPTSNAATKYVSTVPVAVEEENLRLQSWGFNGIGFGSYAYNKPAYYTAAFPLDSNGHRANQVQMPFVITATPGKYALYNEFSALTNPVKSMPRVTSPNFVAGGGYVSPGGIPDWYDASLSTELTYELNNVGKPAVDYLNFAIGVEVDDGDQVNGMQEDPSFTSEPAGHNLENLAFTVATMSPLQVANSDVYETGGNGAYVYTNTQMYSKLALETFLKAEYTTIGNLNSAWVTSGGYTTWDSSGTCVGSQPITCAASVAADSVGTGDGSTLTFGVTLSHTVVSQCSLQILVAGVPVAGENAYGSGSTGCRLTGGVLWGPHASGTINRSTGVLSITFTAGNAPANTAAITATYTANAWGIGTGFLDEADDAASQVWMGTDFVAMSNAHAQVATDMNSFLNAMATQMFSAYKTVITSIYPHLMYLGPNSLSAWAVPPNAPVLQAANGYLDAFITANHAQQFSQSMMNFIKTNFGDKPYFASFYPCVYPDSDAASCSADNASGLFTTQAAEGSSYYTQMQNVLTNVTTSAGDHPYIGFEWFAFTDIGGGTGLITATDNSYDGSEPAIGVVTCSGVLGTANAYGGPFNCGSEPTPSGAGVRPYGNGITAGSVIQSANLLWLSKSLGIIDPSRSIDWTQAGVVGGIPTRTTIYTTIAPFGSFGVPSAPTAINNALAACPAGEVVLLDAGNFYLNPGPDFTSHSNCSLRGIGADQTSLVVFGANSCGGDNAVICIDDNPFYYQDSVQVQPGGSHAANWTAGFARGATSLTIGSVGSAGILNGQYIILDQNLDQVFFSSIVGSGTSAAVTAAGTLPSTFANGATVYVQGTSVSACNTNTGVLSSVNGPAGTFTYTTGAGCTGTITGGFAAVDNGAFIMGDAGSSTNGAIFGYSGASSPSAGIGRQVNGSRRQQIQIVRVTSGCATACTGTGPFTVTISPGLYEGNWDTAKSPGIWWNTGVTGDGVENLTLDMTNLAYNSGRSGIGFVNANNSWASGVRTINGSLNHFGLWNANHISVVNSYAYGTANSGVQSYGVESYLSCDNLVQNNIFQRVSAPFMDGPSCGNVVAYNYSVYDYIGTGQSSMSAGQWLTHDVDQYSLFEGNIGNGERADSTFANGDFNTIFRNRLLGYELDPTAPNGTNKTLYTYPIGLEFWNRYYNIIGNVLGTASYHNTYETSPNLCGTSCPNAPTSIYVFGFTGGDTQRSCNPVLSCVPDNNVSTSVMRWGNYDTVNAAVRFVSGEVPSGLSVYANPVPGGTTLPASFYLSAKPSWWGAMPWPAIGPDVTGGTGPGGYSYEIPAEVCADSIGIPTDGTGSVHIFNASNCYTAVAPTVPVAPTNLMILATQRRATERWNRERRNVQVGRGLGDDER